MSMIQYTPHLNPAMFTTCRHVTAKALESILGKTDNKLDAIMAKALYKLGSILGKIYNKLDAGLSTETCQEWGVVWSVALSHHIPPDCRSSGRRLHLQSQQDEGTCVRMDSSDKGFKYTLSIIMTQNC